MAGGGQQDGDLGAMLGPVVDDVGERLPQADAFLFEVEPGRIHPVEPGVGRSPLALPGRAQGGEVGERLALGARRLAGRAGQAVAPALRRAEVVDQDPAEAAFVDDVRR